MTPAENPEGSARVFKRIEGKTIWNGVAKQLAPNGEFIIWEFYGDPEGGNTAKLICGTGKWKGIKGERKSQRITAEKLIVQGTDQFCQKQVGWIESPK